VALGGQRVAQARVAAPPIPKCTTGARSLCRVPPPTPPLNVRRKDDTRPLRAVANARGARRRRVGSRRRRLTHTGHIWGPRAGRPPPPGEHPLWGHQGRLAATDTASRQAAHKNQRKCGYTTSDWAGRIPVRRSTTLCAKGRGERWVRLRGGAHGLPSRGGFLSRRRHALGPWQCQSGARLVTNSTRLDRAHQTAFNGAAVRAPWRTRRSPSHFAASRAALAPAGPQAAAPLGLWRAQEREYRGWPARWA